MSRGRHVLALTMIAAVAACGGAVIYDGTTDGDDTPTSRPPRGGGGTGGRGGFDASHYPYDAAPASCACDTELEQLDGSCDFTIGDGLIACVADHSDGGSYAPLDTAVSCKADAGRSWTPSKADQLTLCSCVPGETHSLCVKYY